MAKIPRLNDLWLVVPALYQHAISSPFDAPRKYDFAPDRVQKHEGIDFAPVPRPVKSQPLLNYPVGAAFEGVVERRGEITASTGKYIVVSHEFDGVYFFTWYCHLARIDVAHGQRVLPRDVIGLAGFTGNVYPKDERGTHLHFAFSVAGYGRRNYVIADVLDPLPYLVAG